MSKDFIVSGVIKRVMKDKYRNYGYVVLLEEVECENNNIENKWIRFDSLRLSKIFFVSKDKRVSLQVSGKKYDEKNYILYSIIDVVDDEYFQSDATFVKELLMNYQVSSVKVNDVYFEYLDDHNCYNMAIVTKVRDGEVKLRFYDFTDWWDLSEINYYKNIYRIDDLSIIKELMKFSQQPDHELLEVYLLNKYD